MDTSELKWHSNADLTEHYAVLPSGKVVAEVSKHAELRFQSHGDPAWTEHTIWNAYLCTSKTHYQVLGLAKAKVLTEDYLKSL